VVGPNQRRQTGCPPWHKSRVVAARISDAGEHPQRLGTGFCDEVRLPGETAARGFSKHEVAKDAAPSEALRDSASPMRGIDRNKDNRQSNALWGESSSTGPFLGSCSRTPNCGTRGSGCRATVSLREWRLRAPVGSGQNDPEDGLPIVEVCEAVQGSSGSSPARLSAASTTGWSVRPARGATEKVAPSPPLFSSRWRRPGTARKRVVAAIQDVDCRGRCGHWLWRGAAIGN
jgi:hypothetical protein